MKNKALVVLSGGQDSTTCLFWALKKYQHVEAITFDYGQRHRVELDLARDVCVAADIPQHLLKLDLFAQLASNALTGNETVAEQVPDGALPNTFVPGRNILFLSIAAAKAWELGFDVLVTGVGEADYSGYPDCREDFMQSLEKTLQLGMDIDVTIDRPLMFMDKKAIWQLADNLQVLDTIVNHTHTCYNGVREQRHPWGYGCGKCPACLLRKNGYEAFVKEKNGLSTE
jgi:7-cyano-7-deazaguanine synthase